ncbi:uncharacterized protein CcaverHIS019_0107670 [Cutaneotrichosporon cavernicola]|uniref:non-specific serine/threonine protein kinase n=1 Tax=Cutaneotrichosporon cavernicola TaxID=279322 RepID=A0AA48I1W5_9TREE|nr:uncharacterized protein CcaverHIS019_0107670 [Cutaneotrichosporon cavernicola]BEI88049.1 hypothetical protein CcaverHIS019_0107670 [Cutaneotrichosporon cavernicola]BEI95821.1 hypothetical protein CcaverHIS631_0107700 [Cutaneotrichosporon cavernicola]BEJ03594.1 hypothetical protein CcaverHIS641_0107690 [Cutaneotrichosporon cavernicola]
MDPGSVATEPYIEEDTIKEPPEEDVDMNFWLESAEEGDKPTEAGSSCRISQPPSGEGTTPDMPMASSEEEYDDDPESYHSGDSDDYEMDHRPWLERTAVKRDIQDIYTVKGLFNPTLGQYRYRVVDRLGEGTFSSVYLAHDSLHNMHDNQYWTGNENTEDVRELYEEAGHQVALKKILVTSSPARVENELSILENLRGCRNVSPLVTAFRDEDQVVIVLPFHACDDFRYFYRLMDPPKIREYMTCLLRALKDIHGRGIIHRDVKPANFLFDYDSGHGVLVDFGLAERYQPPRKATCQHEPATRANLHGQRCKTADTAVIEQAVYDARKRSKAGEGKVGFRQEDSRPAVKTNRAGTRGFRAPEVLLKCPDQTVAIDVWSAGVILLSILSHKFPVFNSSDDVEALMEIAGLFGRSAMQRCSMLHNRTFISNVPTLDDPPESLASLILRLNPHLYTPHQPHPTQEEALDHILAIDAALDLCSKLLHTDSTKRLTAAQALRHRFLADQADDGPDELLDPTEGKCGLLHQWVDGQHQARFGDMWEDMRFGQGFPCSRDMLCPEHDHWQQRSGVNPLGAAWGATLNEEYYRHAGFHVDEEFEGWDDMGARDGRRT